MPKVSRNDILQLVRDNFPNLSEGAKLELAQNIKSLLDLASNNKTTDFEWAERVVLAIARNLPPRELESDLPTPLEKAHLPTWSYNHLMRNGIKTVEQLLEMRRKEFLRIPNLGRGSLELTQQALHQAGFTASLKNWPT